jgi:hypothetical protein
VARPAQRRARGRGPGDHELSAVDRGICLQVSEDSEPVPKLPRGRGIKLSGPEVVRILITLATLVAVIVLAKPCGDAVGRFVGNFGSGGSAASSAMPRPGTVDEPTHYKNLGSATTVEEVKAIIEGSGAGSGTGSGSATR